MHKRREWSTGSGLSVIENFQLNRDADRRRQILQPPPLEQPFDGASEEGTANADSFRSTSATPQYGQRTSSILQLVNSFSKSEPHMRHRYS